MKHSIAIAYALLVSFSYTTIIYTDEINNAPTSCIDDVQLAEECKSNNNHKQAVAYLTKAHDLDPSNLSVKFDLANSLNYIHRTQEALQIYYEILDLIPAHKSILYNAAFTLKKLNRIQDSLLFYSASLAQDPDYSVARFSRSLAYLMLGDFKNGWKEYEWRGNKKTFDDFEFEQPRWDGSSDLTGKTIYVYGEQGLGDTLQFVRYAQVLKQMGAKSVIVGSQRPLIILLSMCPYIDYVTDRSTPPLNFDLYAPLMSLPHLCGTTIESVPHEIPYLYAHEELIRDWKEKLSSDTNFKVGICWQGNHQYRTNELKAVVAAKSVHLSQMIPFSTVEGVSFYSLQKQGGIDQLEDIPPHFMVKIFDENFDNINGRFMDTAAVIKNLDLVITIDTSISHLAAGLGTPTWVLTPEPPDWRWMFDRTDTPWYPNMRLFRQPTPGDWESVIENITHELRTVVKRHHQQTAHKQINSDYFNKLETRVRKKVAEHLDKKQELFS